MTNSPLLSANTGYLAKNTLCRRIVSNKLERTKAINRPNQAILAYIFALSNTGRSCFFIKSRPDILKTKRETKFVTTLKRDFPDFHFEIAEENLWLPEEHKILYRPNDKTGILHELGHAICGHSDFTQDIELIQAEREAWDKAIEIAQKYGVKISQNRIEGAMNWYRDWLHFRSICPNCSQNGLQQRHDRRYRCLNCNTIWIANDGRNARLHRYIQK
jgi:ribosomal protein S27AE